MKEGQQIIFRHPHSKEILCGVVGDLTVAYAFGKNKGFMPISHITEWCDAEAAFNALALQEVRRGNFEWAQSEGDAGDITRLCANLQHGGDNSNQ